MKLVGLVQSHKKSVFASRLCGLIIDEAHLVYVWRQFRSNYASLSCMRTLWPKVPIMTLSATFAPHVATYVHKSLELMTGAKLIYQIKLLLIYSRCEVDLSDNRQAKYIFG